LKNEVRIEELEESIIDDLVYVCSSAFLDDPVHAKGTLLKRNWLRRMVSEYGSCAKIAYYREKPVAQILFYPEAADPTLSVKREKAIFLVCVFNPFSEAQRLGIGTTLLQSLIQDCRHGLECLGGKPCTFIVTKPFNIGKFLSLPEFYKRNGFKPSPTEPDTLHLDVTKPYIPAEPVERYEPLPEDRGKAIVFYSPVCQFSYQFAVTASRMITEVAPELQVKMFDSWEKPEESIKRKNWWLIVNARPIYKFFMEEEEFKAEVKGAVVEEKNKA